MNAEAAIPLRVLLGLTAAVLAAHVWLLRAAPHRMQAREAARVPTFAMRSIAAPAAPVPPTISPGPAGPAGAKPADRTEPPAVRVLAPSSPAQHRSRPARARASAPAGPAPARFAVPASMQLRYEVTAQTRGQPWQARSELLWQQDGDRYEARLESGQRGQSPRIQLSTGRITAQGLAPLRFADQGRTEQATHFERASERVSFSNNRPSAALLAGAQDRLSVLLQLSAMVGGEPQRYPPGTSISIQTATIRDAETWVFTVGAPERLELPGGNTAALKLDRPPRHEYDQRIELWLDPGQDYVPVRLRLTLPNGDWVDQQWSSTDRR